VFALAFKVLFTVDNGPHAATMVPMPPLAEQLILNVSACTKAPVTLRNGNSPRVNANPTVNQRKEVDNGAWIMLKWSNGVIDHC
jgi:hypothetical protein